MINKSLLIVVFCCLFPIFPFVATIGDQQAAPNANIDFSAVKRIIIPIGTIANITASPFGGAIYHATDAVNTNDCAKGGGNSSALCLYESTGWKAVDTTLTQALDNNK